MKLARNFNKIYQKSHDRELEAVLNKVYDNSLERFVAPLKEMMANLQENEVDGINEQKHNVLL